MFSFQEKCLVHRSTDNLTKNWYAHNSLDSVTSTIFIVVSLNHINIIICDTYCGETGYLPCDEIGVGPSLCVFPSVLA